MSEKTIHNRDRSERDIEGGAMTLQTWSTDSERAADSKEPHKRNAEVSRSSGNTSLCIGRASDDGAADLHYNA